MMYPRLKLARNLLREDGVILVSIDDNEVHDLRALLNEVLGEENFVGQIVVQSNPRGSQSVKHVANVHEYICFYAKAADRLSSFGVELSDSMRSEYKYTHQDGRKYRLLGFAYEAGPGGASKDPCCTSHVREPGHWPSIIVRVCCFQCDRPASAAHDGRRRHLAMGSARYPTTPNCLSRRRLREATTPRLGRIPDRLSGVA